MSTISVGKEVLSYCNKCKLTLAHTIVTMKNETTIGKAECRTCNATHAYKDPSTVKASKTKGGKKNTRATKVSVSDLWMEAVGKSKAKSQDYSIKATYIVNDIIDHPKFGPGVVEKVIDANKIQVIFRHDIKTLIHSH